jgi:hypothetical protein
MRILFAGAKEETKSEPFSDPRVAVRHELDIMTTYHDLRNMSRKRRRFMRGLVKRRRRKRQ